MIIKYFAWIKDITKIDQEKINKDYPQSISELKEYLSKKYPDLEKHINKETLRYAVNMEYTSVNEKLSSYDEIAIFPPVSGG